MPDSVSPNGASYLLQLDQVSVRHLASASDVVPALKLINIRVNAGEQIAIIGPSGAGKTTLLHTMAAAIQPCDGVLHFMGKPMWSLSHRERHALRRHLFLAPQTPPLPSRQRVVASVLAGCLPTWSLWQAVRNLIKPVDPALAWQALSRFQLQDKLYARVDRLSGGERQRCALARLLVSDASLLIVDEPLSALDPSLALQTLQVLQQEAQQANATLICSLHQVELARANFQRIIGLRDGQVMFDSGDGKPVTDVMIAALYENAATVESDNHGVEMTSRDATIIEHVRCF
nr:ATP-binding cassette domain-containing protein [uncultured Undibacterium sp.]